MKQIFPLLPPASNYALWLMTALAVLWFALALLFTYLATTMGTASFEISREGLRLRGDLYGRLIPAQALIVAQAQIINLQHDTARQLQGRTFGSCFPGYQAGWFGLRNGEKSLVYLTDQTRVVYLPTREGYSVMLSTPQPEALLASLKQMARQ
jgi:hypothetical protein